MKTITPWQKFKLLLWKNFLLVERRKWQTAAEIMIPVVFSILVVCIRTQMKAVIYDQTFIYQEFDIINTTWNHPWTFEWSLSYSPYNPVLEKLMMEVKTLMNLTKVEGFQSELEMNKFLTNNDDRRPLAGVVFDDCMTKTMRVLPKNLKFSLRFPAELRTTDYEQIQNPAFNNWMTNILFPVFSEIGPREIYRVTGALPYYYDEKFISVQSAISLAFIKAQQKTEEPIPRIVLERFPYPPFVTDTLLEVLKTFLPIIFFLSFVFPCINNIKLVTHEKEFQLKEAMKIMGLPNWMHWLAWFTKIMAVNMVSITLITILLSVEWDKANEISILTHSNWFLIWLFLMIYAISLTTFAFFISVLFEKANTAATIGAILLFLFYMPYAFTQPNYSTISKFTKMWTCLFHNTGMSYGILLILGHESNVQGLQWSNLFTPISVEDNFSVGEIAVMLLVATFIYMTLTVYIEKVFPGKYGVPLIWYFPVKGIVDYFRKNRKNNTNLPTPEVILPRNENYFESHIEINKIGVEAINLRKVYNPKRRAAVEGLTIKMYENEITVLLGNNGAGKTTTMSMLTCMYEPSSGTARVNDCDIAERPYCVQGLIGLCPQHNILFDDLTVEEHIIFFSKLKGLSNHEAKIEVNRYVPELELGPKRKALSKTLSGGMKRKLNVAVALCGGSKVVFCDEPTSGMDPAARRSLWNVLQKEKKNRTIILSTHFMDEADVLGDQVAIMHNGKLWCHGSSFFLKKTFGSGYALIFEKGPNCNIDGITNLLRQYIPNVKVESNVGAELSYILDKNYSLLFQRLLEDVEMNYKSLGALEFGVSQTTLEEVFMKVIAEADSMEPIVVSEKVKAINITNTDTTTIEMVSTYYLLIWYQFVALFLKKIIYLRRTLPLYIGQIMFPVIVVVSIILLVRQISPSEDLDPLPIRMTKYTNNPVILFSNLETGHAHEVITGFAQIFEAITLNNRDQRTLIKVANIRKHIVDFGIKDILTFNERYLTGVSIYDDKIKAWFNSRPYHAAPLAIHQVFNSLIKVYCPGCSITVVNQPLDFTIESKSSLSTQSVTVSFQMGTNLGFAMCFVASYYIIFMVQERVSKAKHLQYVCGTNVWVFWISAFLLDSCTFIFAAIVLILTLLGFQEPNWRTPMELIRIMAVILCFIWVSLPFIYLLSFLYHVPSTGYITAGLLGVILGVAIFYVVALLETPKVDLSQLAEDLTWFFMFIPHFALTHAFYKLNYLNTLSKVCLDKQRTVNMYPNKQMKCPNVQYFSWEPPGVGRNVFFMIFVGICLFLVLFLKELEVFGWITTYTKKLKHKPPKMDMSRIDSDVLDEINRIRSMDKETISTFNLVIKDMTKYYSDFLAVNQMCIGIKPGECFGLLGINGAGKTTAFKMLTGDEFIMYGGAWIEGFSIKNDLKIAHKKMGYCPQFDALLDYMTGWETLYMYCLLKGVAKDRIRELSLKLASDLKFIPHLDKKTKEYSGGNKRKLSTALALIGNPSVVFLDEPTSGMDPGAQRHLWQVMSNYRDLGKSIVLTSHSMEECEALCTRLAIMVNGKFKCLGSTQHLKNKFSEGFGLTIQMNRNTLDATDDLIKTKYFIAEKLPGSVIKEEYNARITYSVPTNRFNWSYVFGIMETAVQKLNIESYNLSQASLEQVFLLFTKYQMEVIKE